jgi:hypothetical protein
MTTVSYETLPERAIALAESNRPYYASSFTNVAFGTPGADVMELVRRGLWEERHRHYSVQSAGFYLSVYGRKGRKWWPAVEYPGPSGLTKGGVSFLR